MCIFRRRLVFRRGARLELEAAIRLDKTQIDAHYDLGVVLGDLGESRLAEASYRTTLALDPTHADAHNNLGIILARRGDLAEAATHFAEAVRIDPDNKKAAANLARATGSR
ncbi:MAG: tetratricopeptide repeat protein [bacterium]|nr:tetratricopeptide repeat protein [bacterium]